MEYVEYHNSTNLLYLKPSRTRVGETDLCIAGEEQEASEVTIMASSPDKGKETAAAAVDAPSSSSGSSPEKKKKKSSSSNNNNRGEATAAAVAGDEGRKKMVRMSPPQINLLMAFDPPPLEPVRGLTKEEEGIDAIRAVTEAVRTQYEQGGYVEYEAGADLLACPGRSKKKPQGGGEEEQIQQSSVYFTLGHILLPTYNFRLDHPLSNAFTLDRYFYLCCSRVLATVRRSHREEKEQIERSSVGCDCFF